jgi:uncharacterized protein
MNTFFQALFGGALIGIAASILLLINGRIMGASGIISQFLKDIVTLTKNTQGFEVESLWRGFFILGALCGGVAVRFSGVKSFAPVSSDASELSLILGGLLVGFGTRLGLGCTSGHGVCGISRFSMRSLFSTMIFMGVGMLTVYFAKNF